MTALGDLRFWAQTLADRVNATTITTPMWNRWINAGAGRLYGLLTSTYEDYNVQQYGFTLSGTNVLQIGFGSAVPKFDKLRKLSIQVGTNGGIAVWAPVTRANSLLERDLYTSPSIQPYYGNFASRYLLYGQTLEVLPAQAAQGTYMLWYIPSYQALSTDTDSIDSTWMATNGIDEYIVRWAAREAMIKEESLDTAALLMQELTRIEERVLREFAPRDDNQPGKIVDVKRTQNNWGTGGWPYGGLP